ncbi:MAG: hypothetical protein HZC51_10410 [Nitrospirae bacterium]|nr:hypothetical protein [Nitrospirota bacterium]
MSYLLAVISIAVIVFQGVMAHASGESYYFSGDGGPATEASLYFPYGIVADEHGNLYISDTENRRIRKVDKAGIITTVAGGGRYGATAADIGDGGPATSAVICYPHGLAFDKSRNLYIADGLRVRKVDTEGMITTVAGTGEPGFSGDGGPASTAKLSMTWGVAFDSSGNMYIADSINNRIRRVDTDGIITTFMEWKSGPVNVAFDRYDNLYATEGNCIVRVGRDGVKELVAGYYKSYGYKSPPRMLKDKGDALDTGLYNPYGVAVDNDGNVYIADTRNNRIRKVDTDGSITDIAGNGISGFSVNGCQSTGSNVNEPYAVCIGPDGSVYFADTYNCMIRKIDRDGVLTTVAGKYKRWRDDGDALKYVFNNPSGLAVDNMGNLYITERNGNRIVKVSPDGLVTPLAGTGTGSFSGDGCSALNAGLYGPMDIAVDDNFNLYFTDSFNNRIRRVSTDGTIDTVPGGDTKVAGWPSTPKCIALDTQGNIYVSFDYANVVNRIDNSGITRTEAGKRSDKDNSRPSKPCQDAGDGGPATEACLREASGLAFDVSGRLFIADTVNSRIRRVDSDGTISTVAGDGSPGYSGDGVPANESSLREPYSVAFDSSGNLYISDTENYRIRKVDTNGIISTVAGDGTKGHTGDGGPATSASLEGPKKLVVDANGNLFFLDGVYVRKVDTNGVITTVAGMPQPPPIYY